MMKKTVFSALCALAVLNASTGWAQDNNVASAPETSAEATGPEADGFVTRDGETAALADFLWDARVLVIFADSPRDPQFQRQLDLLAERPDALVARDVIVLTETNPAARSDVRRQLRPRGFALVIVDKDGRVMLRKPRPWDIREISRAIDKTPLRQQEIREEKEAGRTTTGIEG